MIEVWIDGCCYPVNPKGTACAGYVIKKGNLTIATGSKIIGKGEGMTNNVAEYHAFINAILEIKNHHLDNEEILVRSDSNLLVNQLNRNWKVKAPLIMPLYRKARTLSADLKLQIKWIPREQNEEADAMSREAFKNYSSRDFDNKQDKYDKKFYNNKHTFPSFLNISEAKQESPGLKDEARRLKKYESQETRKETVEESIIRIGETENFFADYDKSEKLLLLYGKELSKDCLFKLGVHKEEIDKLLDLILKSKEYFN